MATEKKLYKFLRTGLKSEKGKHKDWILNEWRKEDTISICNRGFHASKTPLQALGYINGEILAEVFVRGKSIIEYDKECWSEMKITKAYNWTKEDSVSLAIYSAELVIGIFEKQYPHDTRPRNAIEAAKKYIEAVGSGDKVATHAAYAAADAAYTAANAAYTAANAAHAAYAAHAADAAAHAAHAAYAAHAANAAAHAADAAAHAAHAAHAAYAAHAANAAHAAYAIRTKIDKWFTKKIKTLSVWEK